MSAVEIKVTNKNDDKVLTTKTLHYSEDGIVSVSKDCPILNAIVEDSINDFGFDVDSTQVVCKLKW